MKRKVTDLSTRNEASVETVADLTAEQATAVRDSMIADANGAKKREVMTKPAKEKTAEQIEEEKTKAENI